MLTLYIRPPLQVGHHLPIGGFQAGPGVDEHQHAAQVSGRCVDAFLVGTFLGAP